MRPKLLIGGLVLLLTLAVLSVGRIVDARQSGSDVDKETREIALLLKCPVCQSESVADSSSYLAGEMRDIIHKKLAAGESREAILEYFAGIYGEDVLLDPPKTGFGTLVWAGGLTVPLAGLALAWWTWRGRRASRNLEPNIAEATESQTEALVDDEDTALVEAELERLVGGGAR